PAAPAPAPATVAPAVPAATPTPTPSPASSAAASAGGDRARLLRAHPSQYGPTGGVRLVDAASGPVGSFRVGLMSDLFIWKGFIDEGARLRHFGGVLSLSWTAYDHLEVFGSLRAASSSDGKAPPYVLQTLGDARVGLKTFFALTPWLALGGDGALWVKSAVGRLGAKAKAVSFAVRVDGTADLRGLPSPLPLLVRLNARYVFDNSHELTRGIEARRYQSLAMPRPASVETRQLLTDFERFGLDINRTDRVDLGLGLEAPLHVVAGFYLHPLLEWTWAVPVNRQGYRCPFVPQASGSSSPAPGEQGCLSRRGPRAFPMSVLAGVRVFPGVRGLALTVAGEIGLTGSRHADLVQELAPNPPYMIYGGLSYAYDARAPAPPVASPPAPPPPRRGRVDVDVVDATSGEPVPGAVVAFEGVERNALVADEHGHVRGYPFPPGTHVSIEVSLPGREPPPAALSRCAGVVPPPGTLGGPDLTVRCAVQMPQRTGAVRGRVLGADDRPIAGARVTLTPPVTKAPTAAAAAAAPSPEPVSLVTDAAGEFSADALAPGPYTLVVEADGFLAQTTSVDVTERALARPVLHLAPRPKHALVRLEAHRIVLRRQVHFATGKATIDASSQPILAEVVDVLLRHPEILRVEIQGHTDSKGSRTANLRLSESRAEAVRSFLVSAGIDPSRLVAKGYGPDRPLVPNLTPAMRARNRRVQLVIVERAPADAGAVPDQ
ncbi:MAG: OmpA family protein, partial [Myxococcales bacterium]|nr:OmpA family protein [Myxococcales bacterium]